MSFETIKNNKVFVYVLVAIILATAIWIFAGRNAQITNPTTQDIKEAMTIPQGEQINLTDTQKQEILDKMEAPKEVPVTKQEEEDILKAMGQ